MSRRARRLRLSLEPEGVLRLTLPPRVGQREVARFLEESRGWIVARLGEFEALGLRRAPLRVGVSDELTLRGEPWPLIWRRSGEPRLVRQPGWLELGLPELEPRHLPLAQRLLRDFLAAELRRDVQRVVRRLAPRLGVEPRTLSIRPLRSLWGSLSATGRMSLDLALVHAPPAVLGYVVAHELAHLRIRSHGPRFWRLVAELDPDFEAGRGWIREQGLRLKAELYRLLGGSPAPSARGVPRLRLARGCARS
ncbi:MAG: SprT family zinc-dependent metalloprotease [Xanthomonadales bacterium]|nr:SprT family zinc-dependent metalloprotease [Xanthomonadales bacterium]